MVSSAVIRRIWRNPWFQRALTLALIVLVYAGIRLYQQRDLVVGVAPALHGITLDGEAFSLQGDSRPTLVYFWGTWCPVCRLEQGAIESLNADHRVVTVAMQSGTNAELDRYRKEHGLKAQTLNDLSGELAANWGVRVTPAFFIVDGQGLIRFREVGYTSEFGLRIRLWLAG
jgi:thiol-disulfide isomerase/thioredoxin